MNRLYSHEEDAPKIARDDILTEGRTMAKNLTNVHGKLDKILSRLSALDKQAETGQRQVNSQIRLMTQLLGEVARMARETSQMARETSQAVQRLAEIQEDVAFMANEARKEAKEAKERVIELSVGSQRH